jgi:hypothetical protein
VFKFWPLAYYLLRIYVSKIIKRSQIIQGNDKVTLTKIFSLKILEFIRNQRTAVRKIHFGSSRNTLIHRNLIKMQSSKYISNKPIQQFIKTTLTDQMLTKKV